jgi:L-asparaginase II
MTAVPLVRVVRSGLEESVHLGHVAVCDADGRLLAHAGDPDHRLFGRSCMKPLQASVSLKAMGDLTPPDAEVAVMCASHTGEPVHIRHVRSLLRRAGLGVEALQTPPDVPEEPQARARVRTPRPIYYNCSGKHAGMLLACVRAGWDPATYRRASHPLQRRIGNSIRAATGIEDLAMGVDGCGVPVHGLTLRAMATLYARLARPERLGQLEREARLAVRCMRAEPYLVGGRDRLDTDLMLAGGDVLAKEGAEALNCAAILPTGVGVAVKIADGGYRATGPALLHALQLIDAATVSQVSTLARHARPAVLGGGRPVGELRADFELVRR